LKYIAVQVCHPIYCHVRDTDRIWRTVMGSIIFLSLASGTLVTVAREESNTYLRCLGREETFR
jgi:hypothetical protein